jgi:mannose-6-phosphate isomerase-like protein (cupin superfamily)
MEMTRSKEKRMVVTETPKRDYAVSRTEEQRWLVTALGERLSIRVRSKDVGGAYTIIEAIFPPHVGPPLHIHEREDEIFQITEGRLHFICNGEEFDAGAGDIVVVPKGSPHTWRNNSEESAHVIGLLTPGGADEMFEATVGAPLEQIEDIMRPYGCIFVGPPL